LTNRAPLLATLAVLLLARIPAAQAPAPDDAEAEIRRLAAQVAEIAGKQRGTLDRMDLLQRRIRLDEMMLARLQRQEAAARASADEASARLAELAAREESARRYLRLRMRQLYALGVLQQYRLLFAASSTQDLRAAGFYLNALSQRDAEAFRQISRVRIEQEKVRSEWEAARGILERKGFETSKEREALGAEQARLTAVLAQLGQARYSAQRGLDETLSAARAMDRYVSDLAFRTQVEMMTKDMASSRGRLPSPCAGLILRRFGDFVHPRFKTRVPHPGLDIGAPLGTPVRAVFDGVVEFSGWLSGYGYTVILSHPGGYFSIYGHLDQVDVQKGQTSAQGHVLGAVGESSSLDTTALYFELRQGAQAVDPAPWIKKGDFHATDSQRE
jgi:septal ring factor EnvC (AmiA/AmiB activator)